MNSQPKVAYKEDKADAITKSQLINTSAVKSKLHLLCAFEKCKDISNGSPTRYPRQQNAVPLHEEGVTETEQSFLSAIATVIVKPRHVDKINKMIEDVMKEKADEVAVLLKTAHCQCSNYDKIIPTFLEHGIEKLQEYCPMVPGVLIKPMLAQPTKRLVSVMDIKII
uniref:Uncharacterized protein n=1 Tax=Glossina pallidipes TaxID=7398 RepID=A0A1A9ZPA7_GLOPL